MKLLVFALLTWFLRLACSLLTHANKERVLFVFIAQTDGAFWKSLSIIPESLSKFFLETTENSWIGI